MQRSPQQEFDGAIKKQQRRKRWQKIVSTLVCIVVFCTTYALILPAITISGQITCGMTAHIHTAECYEQILKTSLNCTPGHTHTTACYNSAGERVCGISDQLIHIHNEYCVDASGALACKLPEFSGHLHSGVCFAVAASQDGTTDEMVLCCGQDGILIHEHSAGCFDENGNLICGLDETPVHVHSAGCYHEYYVCGALLCTETEHTHTEDCYGEFPEDLRFALMVMSTDDEAVTVGLDTQDIFEVSDPEVQIAYDDVVYDGDTETYSIALDIRWTLSAEMLKQYDAYHVKLPEHMSIPEDLLNTWRTATDSNQGGMVAFNYRFELVDGEYYIHVEYDDAYIEKIQSVGSCDSYIDFSGTLSKDVFQDDGSLELEWSDGTVTEIPGSEVDYPDNETVNYDIATDKTAVYDSESRTLTYTVLVSSVKGTPSPLTVTDTVNLGGLPLENATPSVTVVDEAGNTVSYTSDVSGSTTTYTFDEGLEENGYYKITYTYQLGSIVPGAVYYPNNTVVAQSTDTTTGETVEAQDSTWTKVTKEMLQKSGVYDSEEDVIRWTITVNPDGDNIAGYSLSDDMMVNGVALGLSISPSTGRSLSIVDGKYVITFTATTDTDDDGVLDSNTNTYTVTYTTAREQTTVNTQITNTAVLTDPDGETVGGSGGSSSVTVPADGGISKTADSYDTATGILNWTLVLELPEGGIGAGTVISDNSGYSWAVNTNHWLTQQQITELADTIAALFPGANYTLAFGTNEWDLKEYSAALADLNVTEYYYWRLTFHEDYIPTADSVSISYKTTFDPNAVATSATYVNSVSMSGKNAWASFDYKVPVTKMDTNWNTGESTVTTTDGIIGWYIRITPEAGKASISITDQLPEGLTLNKLGLGTDGNSARAGYGYSTATSGTLTTWSGIQGAYAVDGNKISVTVTPTSADTIPTGNDIYLYVEARIDDAPAQGGQETYTFKNEATVDGVTVSQIQNVTWNRPLPVIKTDRNGNTGDTTFVHSDGTVGWYVKIYLESETTGTIKLVDYLPDGVTLTKIGTGISQWYASSYSVSDVAQGSTSGVIENTGNTATYSIDGQTVTVTIDKDYTAGSYVYVYLECTYDENSIPDEGLELNNIATVYIDEEPLGTGSQKQTVTPPPEDTTSIVDKTGSWSSDTRQLTYNVLINQGAENLSADSDILKVVDVMTYDYNPWWYSINSVLISSSVKLYYAQMSADGSSYTLVEEVDPTDWTWKFYNNFADIKNSGGVMRNTIEMTVPDEKFLILTYIYEFNVETDYDGTFFNVSNSVTVEGDSTTSDSVSNSNDWEVSDVTAGATSTGTYTITKVLFGNYNIVLPGAVFTVYTYADGHPLVDSDGNVVTYTSGADGKISISKLNDSFEEDVVYYIVETQAPAGYDLPDSPRIIYFYFAGDKEGSYTVPDGATNLKTNYGVAYIENEPEAEESITISKVWLDKDGAAMTPEADSISFHLIQTDYKGNSVHYFKNSLPNGIQIYSNHSVVWVAPFSGALTLSADGEAVDVTVQDLQVATTLSQTDGAYVVESGKPYQIMLSNADLESISWSLVSADDTDSGSIDLSSESWTTTIVVPKSDQEGNAYNYSASELEVDGFVSESATDANGNITITNREEESADLTVKKEWHDDVDEADRKPVSIQLYQSVDTLFTEYTAYLCYIYNYGEVSVGIDSPVKITKAITGQGKYTFTWKMSDYGFKAIEGADVFYIDIVDPNEDLVGYKVAAKIVADGVEYSTNGDFTGEILAYSDSYSRITFYNKWTNQYCMDTLPQIAADGYLEVTITLTPPDDDTTGGKLPDLYEYVSAANVGGTPYLDPITLSSDNGWTGGWTDLPLKGMDSDGNVVYYSYYVVETTDAYDVVYSNMYAVDGGEITVLNYPKTTADLTVNKNWSDDFGNPITPPISAIEYMVEREKLAMLKIYRGDWGWSNEDRAYVKPGSTVTVSFVGHGLNAVGKWELNTKEDYGYVYYNGLYFQLYKYTYSLTLGKDDDIVSFPIMLGHVYDNTMGNVLLDIGFYDYYNTEKVSTGEQIYLGSYTVTSTTPDNYEPEFEELGIFQLDSSNGWSFTHSSIVPAIYRIKELTTGYTTTYELTGEKEDTQTSMSGGGVQFELEAGAVASMVITNKLSTTSLEVEKLWRDNGESSSVELLNFTLYQRVTANGVTTTVPYGSYTITKNGDSWSTAYFTVNGDVKQRYSSGTLSSVDIAMNLGGSIQFTLSEAGTITVVACSTSGSNTSHIALMDADGNLVPNTNNQTDILVSGSNGTTLTWNVPAGTYRIVSPGCAHYYYYSLEHDRAVCVKSITVVEGTGNPAYTYSFNVVEDVTATAHGESVTETTYTVPRTLLISDLPRTDADGNYYTYYVMEDALSGYKAYYSSGGGSETANGADASLTVENDTGQMLGTLSMTNESVTEIGLKKTWASGVTPTAVQLQLWRIAGDSLNTLDLSAYMDASGNVDLEKLKDVAAWQRTVYINCNIDDCGHDDCTSSKSKPFKNLPLYDYNEDGTVRAYYTYFIVEVATGYIKTYTDSDGNAVTPTFVTGGQLYLTNDIHRTSITVHKNWTTGESTPVDVTLYQQAVYYHTHTYTTVVTAATCSAKGYTTYTCSDCGFSYKGDYTETTDHSYGDWATVTPATCAAEGTQKRVCTVCSASETREIAMTTEHTWDSGTESEGIITYTCTVCDETRTEAAPTTCAHANTTTTTVDATCTATGSETVTCDACGETVSTGTIPALGHSYSSVVTAPTCVANGYTTNTCSHCEDTYTDNETPATGEHTYVNGACSVCGETQSTGGPVYLLTEEVVIGYWDNCARVDITSLSFSSGGYFTIKYSVTSEGYNHFCAEFEENIWDNGDDFGTQENQPVGTEYVATISYDDIISVLGDSFNSKNYLCVEGANITITSITWTPAETTSTAVFTVVDTVVNQFYYSDGAVAQTASPGVAYGSFVQVTPGVGYTWTDLPRYILDDEGNIIGEYVYYVVETGWEEYEAVYSYQDADGNTVTVPAPSTTDENGNLLISGITGGTVTITNTSQYHYELPSTGGTGTNPYTLGGIALLIGAAFVLLYNHKKGRKGVVIS